VLLHELVGDERADGPASALGEALPDDDVLIEHGQPSI
jgi:hypothetical protein